MLRNVLFNESRYSSQVIPRRNVTENVEIVMKWNFIRLEGLFEKEARLSQTVGIDLKWKDDYLVWDPSLYGGKSYLTATGNEVWTPDFIIFNRFDNFFYHLHVFISLLTVGSSISISTGNEVWTPDFIIFNRLESSFLSDGLQAEKVLVKYDGTINAQPYGELSTICNADTESFPADCTKCTIIVGASGVSQQHTFVWDKNGSVLGFEDNKDSHAFWKIWRLEKIPIFSYFAQINIYLQRLPAHYIYNIVFPASALSILAVLAFFIPLEEGERLSFGMTIFLSFMVLMLQVSSILPENSKSVSAVGKYFLQLMCSSFVAVFNSVVLSYFGSRSEIAKCTCPLNSIHPTSDDSFYKRDQVIAFNDKQIDTDDTKHETLVQHDNTTNHWVIIGYKRLRNYFRPLQIFNLITLLSCLITTIYAHIELFFVMNYNTCSNVA
ncbi:CHRNA7 [Mytilus coruscus]|uniref:CHRNA7 n=1 Tax=Mytilus coruscus TaxID=42192 RepID=A0A6J8C4Z0_MYTCO|nr:CHRNA7 [Mytilus coruscus]